MYYSSCAVYIVHGATCVLYKACSVYLKRCPVCVVQVVQCVLYTPTSKILRPIIALQEVLTGRRVESNTLNALDMFFNAGNIGSATGRSTYRYWDHKLGGGKRAHKVHKLEDATRAHKVHVRCWQVGGTMGTGVLWRYSIPSLGVMRSTCNVVPCLAVCCLCLVRTTPNRLFPS